MALGGVWRFLKDEEFERQRAQAQAAVEEAAARAQEELRVEYHSVDCPRCGATDGQLCTGPPYGQRRAQQNTHKERELAVGRARMAQPVNRPPPKDDKAFKWEGWE